MNQKEIKRIREIREDDAVSPVIATILMVAITVVLAGTLYAINDDSRKRKKNYTRNNRKIKKRYNQLAKRFHPDHNKNNPKAEELLKEINIAYSIINNSLSLFVPTRNCINHMIANNIKGSIITISSIYGIVAPQFKIYEDCDFISEPDYSYNKSAAIGFSKYIASLYAKSNITSNVIAPGGFLSNQPEKFKARYNDIVPQGRMANGKRGRGTAYSCQAGCSGRH